MCLEITDYKEWNLPASEIFNLRSKTVDTAFMLTTSELIEKNEKTFHIKKWQEITLVLNTGLHLCMRVGQRIYQSIGIKI